MTLRPIAHHAGGVKRDSTLGELARLHAFCHAVWFALSRQIAHLGIRGDIVSGVGVAIPEARYGAQIHVAVVRDFISIIRQTGERGSTVV